MVDGGSRGRGPAVFRVGGGGKALHEEAVVFAVHFVAFVGVGGLRDIDQFAIQGGQGQQACRGRAEAGDSLRCLGADALKGIALAPDFLGVGRGRGHAHVRGRGGNGAILLLILVGTEEVRALGALCVRAAVSHTGMWHRGTGELTSSWAGLRPRPRHEAQIPIWNEECVGVWLRGRGLKERPQLCGVRVACMGSRSLAGKGEHVTRVKGASLGWGSG